MKNEKALISVALSIAAIIAAVGEVARVRSDAVNQGSSQIAWNPDYAAARAQAIAQHKVIMVDTYTDWCEWCHVLDTSVYPDPAVVQAVSQVAPVKVNAEREGADLALKYGVTGFPTILFLNPDGTLLFRIVGYEDPTHFAATVNQVAQDASDLPGLLSMAAANPGDLYDSMKLAGIYIRRKDDDDALAMEARLESEGDGSQLISLYNALGDSYLAQLQCPNAIDQYRKTLAQTAATDVDLLYAHIGLMNCYVQQNNEPGVKAQLNAVLAIPHAPESVKSKARALLARINSQNSGS